MINKYINKVYEDIIIIILVVVSVLSEVREGADVDS